MSARQKLSIAELKSLEHCSEAILADSTDISKHMLTQLRLEKLSEPADYVRDGKSIDYSATGVRRLLEALGLHVEVSCGSIYSATVTKLPVNPNMLLAKLADQTEIRVKVKSQVNFMPGMVIKARSECGTPVFTYEGEYPRIRGRL